VTGDQRFPCITICPCTRTPPGNVSFGAPYGRPYRAGRKIVWMFRKNQRVRWFDNKGRQVDVEQSNVAPAVAFALSRGWVQL
jgi:hypothetical protein